MKHPVFLIILFSSFLWGCASSEKTEHVLEERAAYFSEVSDLNLGVIKKRGKQRKKSFPVYAWRHEAELPNGDSFLGGWLELQIR